MLLGLQELIPVYLRKAKHDPAAMAARYGAEYDSAGLAPAARVFAM